MSVRFDYNQRGGLTVDRESLHATPEYKRQVAAMDQLFGRKAVMGEKMTLEDERLASERLDFERWYVENAFDYEANPLGSRECCLQWKAWQAARLVQTPPTVPDEAVERLAQHIYEQEARNRCKTIDEAMFHRSQWRRAIPEARAMLEATFPAHLTQPAQAVDVDKVREVIAELRNTYTNICHSWADKLTAALPNANGKEDTPDAAR